jgi:hypothetical protein
MAFQPTASGTLAVVDFALESADETYAVAAFSDWIRMSFCCNVACNLILRSVIKAFTSSSVVPRVWGFVEVTAVLPSAVAVSCQGVA